ncbi:MAG TPA: CoA-transferase [Alphaproteobacteria bacterium]|jgi:glutaconate CoA-transferase subunit A|nr:CoA-transferase [Alphaproteobacteria bacterium]
MTERFTFSSPDALAARIPDGAHLAIPADRRGVSMATTRALIRRSARDLRLVAVPTSGLQADLLIGAGAVAEIETSAVSLGEYGPAPRFGEAVEQGRIVILDATCPAIHAGLHAAEKGIPFMPLRGILGSDLLVHRPDWTVIENPLGPVPEERPGTTAEDFADPIVILPAIRPDFALFHVPLADRAGNIWVGRNRDLITMAHAARETLVTVEAIADHDLMADREWAAGTLSSFYVSGIAVAEKGAWPTAMPGTYEEDAEHMRRYAEQARSGEGFAAYLEEFVFQDLSLG